MEGSMRESTGERESEYGAEGGEVVCWKEGRKNLLLIKVRFSTEVETRGDAIALNS